MSLMHDHILPPHSDNSSTLNALQTSIFRTSRTKGAYLFDISTCKEKHIDQQSMLLLKEQHPNVYACVPLNDGPRRCFEVYITQPNAHNDIMNNGLVFPKVNLRIYPRTALDDSAKIVNLNFAHLSLLLKEEVLAGLQQSLAVFVFFMGTGYAVLNVQKESNVLEVKLFQELSRQISWCETKDFFHATWNNIPTWYRYCHKEGHTKYECPLSKARIICYSCHRNEHRSFECPRRNSPLHANKKRDRKSYQSKQKVTVESLILITEVYESEDDPNDPDYSDEDVEQMSVTSDRSSEEIIDAEEVRQLEQDISIPIQRLSDGANNNRYHDEQDRFFLLTKPQESGKHTNNIMAVSQWMNPKHNEDHGDSTSGCECALPLLTRSINYAE
ncbi:hypothetical protein RO3G_15110 [Rhizopus delemar RA 99-880]|uniref:CCHC-type domain-containing protein n=1 Tax=Rhizopus delemar (strain RA 99-880 / ATCC MYA-4621 / FGSC 9543 / NRRL 43880) TaxID=246409 RepID=I1CPL9_RHIO9|nr:hypothetical protein RO3G_15110 [Rhizopus delemar RA 99-880]|eukprot:EIE90399.1 hypothetical protein RO3G_15110 [Rhizopus delemar RA 99-880]